MKSSPGSQSGKTQFLASSQCRGPITPTEDNAAGIVEEGLWNIYIYCAET